MKKFIKYALFVLMALSIAVACIACNGAGGTGGTNNNPDAGSAPEKIEGQLPELDKEVYAPYGELPDLDGVVIDGAIDDELWEGRKWYSQYSTTNRAGMRCTTVFSDKGLYIAAESSDRSIYWTLRNHFDQNTHLVFRIVTGVNNVVQFQVDANNLRPTNKFVNARSMVHGELNQMGKATGISAELYITWDELDFKTRPDEIKIFPYYQYKPNQNATLRQLYPTFMKDLPSTDEYLPFTSTGYLNGDEEWSSIGDHEIGLGKTASWIVEQDEDGNEVVSTNGKRYIYPQAIFFKEMQGNYFSLSARLKVNSASSAIARAGLLVYRDDVNYRSYALEITNDEFSGGKLNTLNIKGYTNYPANVTVTSNFDERANKKGDGRGEDEVDLLMFYDLGRIYYVVNGEYLHSENIIYTNNPYIGLYSVNSDVTFTNIQCDMYDSSDEIREYISEYAYSVAVENVSAETTLTIDQIGVSKKGNDGVTLSFINAPGYTVSELFYRDSQGNEYDILDEVQENGVYAEYKLTNIDDNITIYCNGAPYEGETVDVKMFFYDSLLGEVDGMQKSVSFVLTGSGAFTNYSVEQNFADGIATVAVPKGYDWKFYTNFAGYRTSRGVVADGATLNESMTKEQYVAIVAPVVGGTATSATSTNQVSSSIGNYWDISNEENGEVTFQTTNNRYSYVYFSGPTMSNYHVAYVEMTNETDPLAFTSLERDPAAGFIVHNGAENLAMIRYDGMRLVPGGMSNFGARTDAGNLIEGYPGYVVNTSSGVMTGDPYISNSGNTVNRLAYNDRVDTTSLLMIRNNTTMYFYIADGSAKVTPDKINFDKLEFLYSYENREFGGEAAIGIGVTVSYNLRVKFSNYWLLSGAKAMAFSNELITSTLEKTGNGADNVRMSSDGMYESDGETRIVEGSDLSLTVDSSIKANGKIAKITVNNTTRYVMGGKSTTINIPDSGKHYVVNCELVDAIDVTGSLDLPEGVATGSLVGKLYAGTSEQGTFSVNSDATFNIQIPKNVAYSLLVTADGYATQKVTIPASTTAVNVGALNFIELPFGGILRTENGTTVNTTEGYTYSVNDAGVPVAQWYSTSTANNIHLSLKGEAKADAVVKFSFSRKGYAASGLKQGTDETDLGIGVYMTDGAAAHKILFMTTGYRIFDSNQVKYEARGITTVNVGTVNVEQIDFMLVKRASYLFMYSKYATQTEYQLANVWHAMDNGKEVMAGKCNFQVAMTSWPGRFLNVDIFNVSVEDLDPSKFPELTTEVTLDCEGGEMAIDTASHGFISKAGNTFTVYKGLPLNVIITPDEGNIVGSIIKNGNAQALEGYAGGVYNYAIEVDGPTTITAEFLSSDDVAFISGTVTDNEGKPMAYYTFETSEGYSTTTDKNGNFKDLIAANATSVNFIAESVGDYLALDSIVSADGNGKYNIVVKKSVLGGSATVGNMTYYSGNTIWSDGTARNTNHGYNLIDTEDGEIALWENKVGQRTAIMFTGVASDKLVVRASITWNHAQDMWPIAGFIFRDGNGGKDGLGVYGETPNGTTGNIRSWYGGWKNGTSPEAIPYRHVGNHQGISLAETMGTVDMVCVYNQGTYDFYARFIGAHDDKWYHLYNGTSFNGETKVNGGAVAVGLVDTTVESSVVDLVWSNYSVAIGQEAIDAFYYNNLNVVSGDDVATVEVTGAGADKQLVVTPKASGKQVTSVEVNGETVVGLIGANGAFTYDLPRCPEIGNFDVEVTVGDAEEAIAYTAKATIGGDNVAGVEVIFARDNNVGYKAVTDANGQYTVTLPEGDYTVYFSHEKAFDRVKEITVDGSQIADVNLSYGLAMGYKDSATNTYATYGVTYDETADNQLETLVVEQRSLNATFALQQPIRDGGTLEFYFKASEGHSFRNGVYSDLDEYYKWTLAQAGGVSPINFGINSSGNNWGGTKVANVLGAMTQSYKDKIYHEYGIRIVRNGATVEMYHKLNDGAWTKAMTGTLASATADYFLNICNDGKPVCVEINRTFYGFKYTEA